MRIFCSLNVKAIVVFILTCGVNMVIPNDFLLNCVQHNRLMKYCFCALCRRLRLEKIDNDAMTRGELYNRFMNILPNKIDVDLNKCFADTLDVITSGKAYKDACLRGTVYKYFKPWAKHEPRFADLPEKEFNLLCHKVNECSWIFDNWDKITANLMDYRMTEIDARRLSVSQLYKTKSIDWCLQFNDTLRRKSKRTGDEPLYPSQKFDDIFQNIVNSGILADIEYDPSVAASLGGRLQSAMITYCRRRYQPY